MRKILLITIVFLGFYGAKAQCTPDPQYTAPGIYPDSATGLPAAYVGYPYDEVITAVVPVDTVVNVPPLGPFAVTILNIQLTNVTGLPANFSYSCTPSNCTFPGGSSGCVNLYSTQNPMSIDIGLYPLNIYLTTTVDAGIAGQLTQNDTLTYYYIEILDSTGVGVGIKKYTDISFELADIYPNPVENEARIQFVLGQPEQVNVSITNLLGEIVDTRTVYASQGVNTIYFDTDKLTNGIYLYSIESNGRKLTKRMIVSK